ncbi:MAG: hypothetical protein ACQEP8_05405 [Chlamydiota bacterium]
MRLVDVTSGKTIVDFQEGNIAFGDGFLKKDMQVNGVSIPDAIKAKYDGQSSVKLDDHKFEKAFKEVYYQLNMNHKIYQWQDEGDQPSPRLLFNKV